MNEKHVRAVKYLRGFAVCVGIAMIVLGVFRGENAVVLKKAVRICLECIGVG